MSATKHHLVSLLRWSEKYTKTDMVYLTSGGFWLMAQYTTTAIAGLALFSLLSRTLTTHDFGTYRFIIVLVGTISALSLTGMTTAVTQSIARKNEQSLPNSIPVQLQFGIFGISTSALIALYYFMAGNITIAIGALVGTTGAIVGAAYNTFVALYNGRGDFRGLFFSTTGVTLVQYGSLAIATYVTGDVLILASVFFISGMIVNIVTYQYVTTGTKLRGGHDPEAIRFGKHLSFLGIFSLIAINLDSVLVFHYLGATDLAIYATALVLPEKLKGITKLALPLALPKFARKESAREAHAAWRSKLWMAATLSSAIAIIYIATAPFLFKVLFPNYMNAIIYSQVFALSVLAGIAIGPVTVFIAQRSTRDITLYNTLVPIFQILFVWIGIVYFGLWGAVGARVVSLLVAALYAFYLSRTDTPAALPISSKFE